MVGKAEDDELYKVDPPIDRKEMPTTHPLLIIGAGPFGLAVAADALYHRLPVSVVGRPMGFWRENMPKGMVLRSASDWHLDPQDVYTMEVFLAGRGLRPGDVEPLPIELYLDYAAWFQQQAGVVVDATEVVRLDVAPTVASMSSWIVAPCVRPTSLWPLGCVTSRTLPQNSRPCFQRDGSNTAATSSTLAGPAGSDASSSAVGRAPSNGPRC
jgi:hypothetical protein